MLEMVDEFSDAVVFGDFDRVKELIASDSSIVNQGDQWGYTALHNVMSEEQFEMMEYIIAQGANVNAQTHDGIAPLHLACYPENAAILLRYGADINIPDQSKNTPLHVLAAEGEKAYYVIEFLLKHGADPLLENIYGDKPVDISRKRHDIAVVKLFKNYM